MKRLLVHTHIYYEFLYPELKRCLLNLSDQDCDYFFTLVENNSNLIDDIKKHFQIQKLKSSKI